MEVINVQIGSRCKRTNVKINIITIDVKCRTSELGLRMSDHLRMLTMLTRLKSQLREMKPPQLQREPRFRETLQTKDSVERGKCDVQRTSSTTTLCTRSTSTFAPGCKE